MNCEIPIFATEIENDKADDKDLRAASDAISQIRQSTKYLTPFPTFHGHSEDTYEVLRDADLCYYELRAVLLIHAALLHIDNSWPALEKTIPDEISSAKFLRYCELTINFLHDHVNDDEPLKLWFLFRGHFHFLKEAPPTNDPTLLSAVPDAGNEGATFPFEFIYGLRPASEICNVLIDMDESATPEDIFTFQTERIALEFFNAVILSAAYAANFEKLSSCSQTFPPPNSMN